MSADHAFTPQMVDWATGMQPADFCCAGIGGGEICGKAIADHPTPASPHGAREAVAQITNTGDDEPYNFWAKADEILAVLAPIIAAEIRAWAEQIDADLGESEATIALISDADPIASRICGGEA
jgi:hypothetical protein